MKDKTLPTEFAPAERAPEEEIQREADLLLSQPGLRELLDFVPEAVLVINPQRQIVFANQAVAGMLQLMDREAVYGRRPGEALNCIHADRHPGGCGTSAFCRMCGAVNAVLAGLQGKREIRECRITQKDNSALDLQVAVSPLNVNGDDFIVIVISDISHEKRRRVLERIFFHDILNTITGLYGLVQLIQTDPNHKTGEFIERVVNGVNRLISEINSQRLLLSAENEELSVNPAKVNSLEILNDTISINRGREYSQSIQIRLDDNAADFQFVTDCTLLNRVLENMLKNALEASSPGDEVVTGCELTEDKRVRFWVKNPQFMPEDIQLQVFKRSFSTKGKGRGVGTYSMKLLTERYLNGKISFTSSPEQGTTFEVILPAPI